MPPPPPLSHALLASPPVLHFLPLHDLLLLASTSRAFHARCLPARKRALRTSGVEPALRLRYWAWCAGVDVLFGNDPVTLVAEFTRCLGSVHGLASLDSVGTG